jgi:subtilisin family serine protease
VLARGEYRKRVARLLGLATALLLSAGVPQATSEGSAALPRIPAGGATFADLLQAVGGRGASQSPLRYAYLHKLDGHLQDVAASRLGGAGNAASGMTAAHRQGVATTSRGEVAVDVYVNGDVGRAADELRSLGMRVSGVSVRAPSRVVEGFVPPEALAQAAALPSAHAIVSALSRTDQGSVVSEGDAAIHGPQARVLGPTGAGVSVGIISDSIDNVNGGVSDSQATLDLPANVQVLADDPSGIDEGRAMAEIVYDEAPGISGIAFSTAEGGPVAKVNAIDDLVAHGVRVIADDTAYLSEPFFQDGIISQAVDRAKAAGVAYFISAGNDGRHSWEGTYTGGTSEDFDPGPAVDTIQTVGTVPAGRTVTVMLQWAEPWGGATTNLALDVHQISGGTVSTFGSDSDNLATGLPEESVQIVGGSSDGTFGISIRRVAGTGSPFMKVMDFTNGVGSVAFEYPTDSGAVDADAASARGALTVAASNYGTPTTPEPYSSNGPVTRLFDVNGHPLAAPDVRHKPELAAPDHVSTSVPGPFVTFSGTSAASPAAAGIAALILSAKPSLGVDELYAIMTNPVNALDCTRSAVVPDPDCGAGFLLADRAVTMALDRTPPVIAPALAPATPDGANGWYRTPVNVTWSVSDAESPVIHPAGCDATSVAASTTLTCSATSAGGTAAVPLAIKIDSTPPTAPAFIGIGARTYAPAALPPAASIRCIANDATSGIAGCTIAGYKLGPGAHTLTAIATDAAGLSAKSTLTYTVSKPPAIAQLTLARSLTLAQLARSGIPLSVHVAAGSTRLVVTLVARVPKASGRGTVALALGSLTRKVPAGTAHLRIGLTARAKRQLRGVSKTTLKVTVRGTSSLARGTSLLRSLVLRR